MRERVKDKGRLEHILNAIEVILINKERYTYDNIVNDPIVFYGFVKHVEIIGEAVDEDLVDTIFKEFCMGK